MATENGPLPVVRSAATPMIGLCGATESQRKALLSFLVPALLDHGLQAAVAVPGTGQETFPPSDLILVEGEHRLPAMIWLEDGRQPPPKTGSAVQSFGPERRQERVLTFLLEWIAAVWRQTPVWGCVLIGGRSSRMGCPKHLLQDPQGQTWLERTVGLLGPLVTGLVLSGKGDVPESLGGLMRLPDILGLAGPLSGILAAMRRYPSVSWLLVACDMPDIREDALRWLLARNRPGVWGTVPRLRERGRVEPLLALYDFRCASLLDDLANAGCLRIGRVAENAKIETPQVPEALRSSWRNVNTPEDL